VVDEINYDERVKLLMAGAENHLSLARAVLKVVSSGDALTMLRAVIVRDGQPPVEANDTVEIYCRTDFPYQR
jgi:hypothetical protein